MADFAAASVVGEEKNQRVVELSGLFERADHLPDSLIHTVDHCRMDGHGPGIPFSRGILFPTVVELPFGEEILLVAEESRLPLPFVTCLADLLPACGIGVLVFLDILGKGMQRPVGGRVGQIHEEGFLRIGILPDLLFGAVGKRLREIVPFGHLADRDLTLDQTERVEIVHDAVNRPVMGVEAPVDGVVAQIGEGLVEDFVVEPVALVFPQRSFGNVPFSDHRGRVAGIAEHLGDRHGIARKGSAVAG